MRLAPAGEGEKQQKLLNHKPQYLNLKRQPTAALSNAPATVESSDRRTVFVEE